MNVTTQEHLGLSEQPASLAQDKPHVLSTNYVWLILGLSAVWGVLMHQFGESPIYWVMGPYALVVCTVLLLTRGHALRARLRPNTRLVLYGVGLGLLMTLLTYPAFDLTKQLFPQLVGNVADLYRQSQAERLSVAFVSVTVILTAEELLWRGAWYEALCPRVGPNLATVIAVVSYALTQLASGSFIVCLLAIVCGTAWTLTRRWTKSIVPALIAHMIWTPTVILFIPVTWQ